MLYTLKKCFFGIPHNKLVNIIITKCNTHLKYNKESTLVRQNKIYVHSMKVITELVILKFLTLNISQINLPVL